VGKVPKSAGEGARQAAEVNRLRRELKRAVDQEDFERATVLSDLLRRKEESSGS
jgi:protein-arginine kinase activator protein McsA